MALFGRAICNIGFIERPLLTGFAWWTCTGDIAPAMPLALFFELFWLDLFPIGSFIPPMAVFPYLLLLALSGPLGWTNSTAIVFPLIMSLPLAYVIPYMELALRNHSKFASDTLLLHAQEITPLGSLPARLIHAYAIRCLVFGLFLFLAAYTAVLALYSLPLIKSGSGQLIPGGVDWPALYVVASVGALLSLRIKKAYLVFAACVVAVLLLQMS